MDKATYTKMIDRRASKGFNRVESMMMLSELIKVHEGDNLAQALVYNEFATEKQAYNYINS